MIRAGIVALLVLAGCEAPPALLPTQQFLRDVYTRGAAAVPLVALTFDDGPNGLCTAAVLDALAASGTPATFFVLGKNLRYPDNAELLARMIREGHAVGLHGWAHSTLPLMKETWAAHELARSQAAVVAAAGDAGMPPPDVQFYRPPYGFLTGPTVRAAASARLDIVEWTVSVEDWRDGWDASALTDTIVREIRPGDVIVLHDGHETAHDSAERCVDRVVQADAVRLLVPALQARGLGVGQLATVLGLSPSLH